MQDTLKVSKTPKNVGETLGKPADVAKDDPTENIPQSLQWPHGTPRAAINVHFGEVMGPRPEMFLGIMNKYMAMGQNPGT